MTAEPAATTPLDTRPATGLRVSRVLVLFVYGFATACTVILAIAFFLELFNANEGTPFVAWVFRATDRVMQPFRGIFPAAEGAGGSVFDPSLLFAMFMYWLLALGMHALVDWIDRKLLAAREVRTSSDPSTAVSRQPASPPHQGAD